MFAFTAAQLLSPTGVVSHPVLLIEEGRIANVFARSEGSVSGSITLVDFGEAIIAPGYIDLHIHGSGGYDVMDDDSQALPAIETFLALHGVTSYFPTTVTAPLDATLRALDRLAAAIEKRGRRGSEDSAAASYIAAANHINDDRIHGEHIDSDHIRDESNHDHSNHDHAKTPGARATALGIHLEGPFISHARRGVHPPQSLLPPTLATFEKFWQAAQGRIRMMTIAPELDGALEVIAEAAKRGVCVSLGHSDADFAASMRGIDAGARHATHTFNAMRPLDHRSPGILGAVLTDPRLSADIISDGVHLDPSIVKLFAEAKGANNTVLISDAISATGMPDGRHRLGTLEVDVSGDRCTSEGRLAGSVLTLDRAVRNLAQFAQWELNQAVMAASHNPAQTAKLRGKGKLVVGADADFVVLSRQGEVLKTFVGGTECAG